MFSNSPPASTSIDCRWGYRSSILINSLSFSVVSLWLKSVLVFAAAIVAAVGVGVDAVGVVAVAIALLFQTSPDSALVVNARTKGRA